jgi:hypothetical protein
MMPCRGVSARIRISIRWTSGCSMIGLMPPPVEAGARPWRRVAWHRRARLLRRPLGDADALDADREAGDCSSS